MTAPVGKHRVLLAPPRQDAGSERVGVSSQIFGQIRLPDAGFGGQEHERPATEGSATQELPQFGPLAVPSGQRSPARVGPWDRDEPEDRQGAIEEEGLHGPMGDKLNAGQTGRQLAYGGRGPHLTRDNGGGDGSGGDDALSQELPFGFQHLTGMECEANVR